MVFSVARLHVSLNGSSLLLYVLLFHIIGINLGYVLLTYLWRFPKPVLAGDCFSDYGCYFGCFLVGCNCYCDCLPDFACSVVPLERVETFV